MRAAPRRTLLLVGVCSAGLLLTVGLAATQDGNQDDARNNLRGESKRGQDCLACHVGWSPPMRDSHVVRNVFPQSLRVHEPAEFAIRLDNPWIAEIVNVQVTVTLLGADNPLLPGTANLPAAETVALQGNLSHKALAGALADEVPPARVLLPFDVGPNARSLVGRLELYPFDPGDALAPPDINVTAWIQDPGRNKVGAWDSPQDSSALVRNVEVDRANLTQGGWNLWLNYTEGGPARLWFDFRATIEYGSDAGLSFDVASPGGIEPRPKSAPSTPRFAEYPFRLVGTREGTYPVEAKVRVLLHYKHGTAGTYDWENYTRYATTDVVVGQVYVPPNAVADLGALGGVDPRVTVAEVAGIGSALLLPPALFVGGSFGKGSRQLFNTMLGGAKRRVMFHSTVSLGLTAAALLHVVLFLWETNYRVATGLLWGGLGLLCLLGLALTGYYQVPLIQKYGYAPWRVLHLALGVLVVLFAVWHSVLDGADFVQMRESLPEWLTRWNLEAA